MSEVRVLIVDDQVPFREAMRMVVDVSDGFVCVGEAADGQQAVELSSTLRPDLVLIDVQMPIKDGLVATREIRTGETPPYVFVLSTHESSDHANSALDAGASAFIPKSSFSTEVLTESWERARRTDSVGGGEPPV